MSLVDLERLCEIAEVEFSDLVIEVLILDANELRIILRDRSFVDVWFSLKLHGRYSYSFHVSQTLPSPRLLVRPALYPGNWTK